MSMDIQVFPRWKVSSDGSIAPIGDKQVALPAGVVATPSLRIGSTQIGLYLAAGGRLGFGINGGNAFNIDAGKVFLNAGNCPTLMNETPSGTNPVFTYYSDTDSGLGIQAANKPCLISSGAEKLRVDNDLTAGNTALLIYDVDNATVERVSVGAADSGGAGFKVLRIAN